MITNEHIINIKIYNFHIKITDLGNYFILYILLFFIENRLAILYHDLIDTLYKDSIDVDILYYVFNIIVIYNQAFLHSLHSRAITRTKYTRNNFSRLSDGLSVYLRSETLLSYFLLPYQKFKTTDLTLQAW